MVTTLDNALLEEILQQVRPLIGQGKVADYIPALAEVPADRLAIAVGAVASAELAVDLALAYTKERTAFGEPIGQRQAVAFTISNIGIELDGLRLATWRAASRLDRGEDASAEIAQARNLVSRHATWIGSRGVLLLGGHGFVKEFDNERWYRDLRGAGVLEGTLLV